MYCDLVGSTELSARYEPEDLRTIVRAYQDACAGVVARLEGYVARYMGDGVLVYFGFPRAHEDDAERAVKSAVSSLAEQVSDFAARRMVRRSEEHTSELQSLMRISYAVFCLNKTNMHRRD